MVFNFVIIVAVRILQIVLSCLFYRNLQPPTPAYLILPNVANPRLLGPPVYSGPSTFSL